MKLDFNMKNENKPEGYNQAIEQLEVAHKTIQQFEIDFAKLAAQIKALKYKIELMERDVEYYRGRHN